MEGVLLFIFTSFWDLWDANSETLNRANGLRDDAASFLADTKPAFLRFPGGNNLYVLGLLKFRNVG